MNVCRSCSQMVGDDTLSRADQDSDGPIAALLLMPQPPLGSQRLVLPPAALLHPVAARHRVRVLRSADVYLHSTVSSDSPPENITNRNIVKRVASLLDLLRNRKHQPAGVTRVDDGKK